MKNLTALNFRKLIVSLILVAFGFSLQSFIGVRIEKRHYRKGYYIHIWRNPKNKPVHTATEKVIVKQEVKQEKVIAATQSATQQKEALPSNDDEQGRGNAPVCHVIEH